MNEVAEHIGTLLFYLVIALLALAACAMLVTFILFAVHMSLYILSHTFSAFHSTGVY